MGTCTKATKAAKPAVAAILLLKGYENLKVRHVTNLLHSELEEGVVREALLELAAAKVVTLPLRGPLSISRLPAYPSRHVLVEDLILCYLRFHPQKRCQVSELRRAGNAYWPGWHTWLWPAVEALTKSGKIKYCLGATDTDQAFIQPT